MKISPIAPGQATGNPDMTPSNGKSNLAERMKARLEGKDPAQQSQQREMPQGDSQVERLKTKSIKMRTQYSSNREVEPVVDEQINAISTNVESTNPVSSDPKLISPQLAAIARDRRALQVKEREIADREKALQATPPKTGSEDFIARLQSDPLSVLSESGLLGNEEFYTKLTEAILANPGDPELRAIKEELKTLKEGQEKAFDERDQAAEQQVLAEFRSEVDQLSAEGEEYEMIRLTKSQPQVVDLIHRTWKQSRKVLDVAQAMKLVEDQLITDNLPYAQAKKVQSRLTPQVQQPQMRTLTNRDSATPSLSRRDRMINAFHSKK